MVNRFLIFSCVATLFSACMADNSATVLRGTIDPELKSSAFSLTTRFDTRACFISTGSPALLPEVFTTPEFYTSAGEIGDERRVSNFKSYFMSLSSRARVDESSASIARDVILSIAQEDRMRWGSNWRKNSSNVFFFTVSALQPVALEYYHQRTRFTPEERAIIEEYLNRKWRELSKTKVLQVPLIDNKLASYAAFSYSVGLATNNSTAKNAGVRAYRQVLREMRSDGSNPLDSERAGSAVHYTNLNVSSLVTTAELAAIDGLDLYSYRGINGGLGEAIDFLVSTTRDQRLISRYARADGFGFSGFSPTNQDLRWPRSDMAAWVALYVRRFPDTDRARQLLNLTGSQPIVSPKVSDHAGGNTLCWTKNR